jgi:hypothetical protein
MVCIGTTSSEKRKEFGRQFGLYAMVTFLWFVGVLTTNVPSESCGSGLP